MRLPARGELEGPSDRHGPGDDGRIRRLRLRGVAYTADGSSQQDEPQYELESDTPDLIALHTGSAMRKFQP